MSLAQLGEATIRRARSEVKLGAPPLTLTAQPCLTARQVINLATEPHAVASPPTGAPADPVLSLTDVHKSFGGLQAVNGLSLDIERGEFFTLLGPSGCGKTTTLRMVAGLEQPSGGAIRLRGRTVASAADGLFVAPDKRNLGMVFQSYAIWPHMTVFENVAYPLQLRKLNQAAIRAKVAEVLDQVGLKGLERRPATLLSGGQQQRLALCRALVYEPDLLLLDEPFSNLDAKLREQMRLELKLLHRRLQVTVLFVTHDQIEALSLSDRIAVMSDGRLEQLGSPQELYERPRSVFVRDFLGQTILLGGRVAHITGEHVQVDLTDAPGSGVVGQPGGASKFGVGDEVSVAIRPEDLEVGLIGPAQQPDERSLPATVEAALFIGDRYQVGVTLASGRRLLLSLPRSRRWQPGERLYLGFPPEAVSIWPA
ncbi:MAG: ABC transporter ATP-binding protein [Chloroflexi bacterium]|nr:ABC transporter ATP-binding protein [Chloroflexota bacterium]